MKQPTKSLTRRFLELIRFSHTVFALPFAGLACVWALVLPNEATSPSREMVLLRLVGVLACMITARAAAMAFNRLVDADYDARNPRTAGRHLPAGELSRRQVRWFFVLSCVGFVATCALFLPNWLPLLGAAPVLLWICGYSYAKRFTAAAHVWLGVALALSPICAWIAIRGEAVLQQPADILPACLLGVAIALWVAGFDTIYACQDADYDRTAGLHSLPARLGVSRALRVAQGFHALMLLTLIVLPLAFPALSLGWLYAIGVALVAVLIVRQHAIISPSDMRRMNEAFFQVNAVISFGLAAIASLDAWLR